MTDSTDSTDTLPRTHGFEVKAAFAIGILLPALETCRRGIGEWGVDFTTMFTDYLAGALLLIGAGATYARRQWGPLFLVVAWAWTAEMMTASLADQIERHVAKYDHRATQLTGSDREVAVMEHQSCGSGVFVQKSHRSGRWTLSPRGLIAVSINSTFQT